MISQAITWANVDQDLCRQMASLDLNELKPVFEIHAVPWSDTKDQEVLQDFALYLMLIISVFSLEIQQLPLMKSEHWLTQIY